MPGGTVGTPVAVIDYVTLDEVKEYLAIESVTTVNDDTIEDYIPGGCRAIDAHCGRRFSLRNDLTTHRWPNAKGTIYTTDLRSSPAPTVYVDTAGDRSYSTLVDAADYELLPFAEDDVEISLYQEIAYISGRGWFDPRFPARLNGDHGWTESDGRAPHMVRQATCMLMARYWKRRETPAIVMAMPAIGFRNMIDEDKDIQRALAPYVHQRKKKRPLR